jgi:hypothetical protein
MAFVQRRLSGIIQPVGPLSPYLWKNPPSAANDCSKFRTHIFQSHCVATFVLLSGGCKSAGTGPSPFSFSYFFFPQLPTLFPMPSSPLTALGGFAFYTCIIQKQATHGTQSMGFEVIHQP